MSSLGSPNPFFIAGKKAYEVERSLRFNDSDAPKLQRTLGSSGNRRTFTWSGWVKRAAFGHQALFSSTTEVSSGNSNTYLLFNSSHQLTANSYNYPSGTAYNLITTQLFRDVGAWYHIVWAIDTTQSTSSNRIKLYVNGEQVTSFSTASYPSQNYEGLINNSSYKMLMGNAFPSLTNNAPFDGYMAEVNFIDGYQYDPSYFGKTDPVTGQWNPKKYVGSYGTNGFYLNFSDNSGTTATTLGKDSSGNGNNFTPNNFVTGDAVKDSPTNNFAVLRTHSTPEASGVAIAEGNLKYTTGSSGGAGTQNRIAISTFLPTSGKWYAEVMATSSSGNQTAGIIPYAVEESPTTDRPRYNIVNFNTGQILKNLSGSGTTDTYGASISTNDVLCIYMDMDAKTVYYGKNGQWGDGSGSWNQSTPTSGSALGNSFFNNKTGGHEGFGISIMSVTGGASITCTANFGQDSTFAGTLSAGGNADANGKGDFKYTVPTGAKALCSANLPDPTIKLPNQHFNSLLYTATGNAMTATDTSEVNFTPDFLWQKRRDSTGGSHSHYLFDSVRGGRYGLQTNTNGAEFDSTDNSNIVFVDGGFEMAASNGGQGNGSGGTYVAWNWNGGDTDGKTYTVKVVSDSGNKYRFDDFGTSAVTLDLAEGGTYIFDQSDSSNATHPLRFYTAADKSGGEYTTGVTTAGTPGSSGAYTQIVVAASAPTLYYQCSSHAGMGGQVNTNSTLGSSNFDGAIQSTVKVNATAGFSITNFYPTAASTAVTTGHGLGVTPDVVIVKSRGSSANWDVLHMSLGSSYKLYLNGTNAQISSGAWGSTNPTSSVFTYNPGSQNNNNQIAYCFSEVAGYSKFGSWTAVGSTDGRFVFTGFRPAWVMAKQTTGGGGNWFMVDDKRSPFNVVNDLLDANINNAERNADIFDFLSNGFKIRLGLGTGETFIYLAFAESPFKNARAR